MMVTTLEQSLMEEFAEATGLTGKTLPRRYLWTDAFAVCNLLVLARSAGEVRYLTLARDLVDQVHHTLGRHRSDDPRSGWISGLSESEGERHPTRGGLRIGKLLNERGPEEPPDPQLEWDQDGQYFHYLTKWMHALHRMSQETGESHYLHWAVELAVAAHDAFTMERPPGSPKRMVWKMSIDLSRPLVDSMGQHDPLDGLITCLELQTDQGLNDREEQALIPAITAMTQMCFHAQWVTHDPLGIGGLLDNATRLSQLIFEHHLPFHDLLDQVLLAADRSLRSLSRTSCLSQPAETRLPFRELGLSIGLKGLPMIRDLVAGHHALLGAVNGLLRFQPFAEQIESFWSSPRRRTTQTWTDHQEINRVMLATSLAPESYLEC
jgi:hypothetical protein